MFGYLLVYRDPSGKIIDAFAASWSHHSNPRPPRMPQRPSNETAMTLPPGTTIECVFFMGAATYPLWKMQNVVSLVSGSESGDAGNAYLASWHDVLEKKEQ